EVGVTKPSPGLPEFVIVGYVDGNLITRYDSNTRRAVAGADWMAANLGQEYWDDVTGISQRNEEIFHVDQNTLRERYNQSGGEWVRTYQWMYGCDLLADGSTKGYSQEAFNGKDFISFDMDTMTFTAADARAVPSKRAWEKDGLEAERWKHYLNGTCIEWLKKYVSYGRAVLERKELPTVRVSAKETPEFLTLRCRVYGFYPRPIVVNWLKDSEVMDSDTLWSGIVPNSDGTFYAAANIDVRPEEKDRYQCRVEHTSLAQPGLFALEDPPKTQVNLLVIIMAVVGAIVAVAVIVGFVLWKLKSGK
ncbi:HA1F protein, partial [Centropus unirufus]|nr:HA1F protein [Centropus unirufus]